MTLKASLNKFNPAYNLFWFTVKKSIGLTILFSIFMLLICPGYTLLYIKDHLDMAETAVYNFSQILPTLITGISIVTSAFAMLFCFINFSFLYSKKATDVFHALPTTRIGLLMARFLASIVPVLLSLFLVYGSMLVMLCFAPVTGSAKPILLGLLYNILAIVFCTSFTLIFIICAGSIADLIISFLTVNVGLVLIVSIFIELGLHFLIGYNSSSLDAIAYSVSPFLFMFIHLAEYSTDGFAPGNGSLIFTAKAIFLIIAFCAASCILYNRRKSEKSGVSYAYRFMYVACSLIAGIVGSFGLGLIFGDGDYNLTFWIFAVVGGVLTSITFGVITDRGFKTVKKSIAIGLSSLVLLSITATIMWSGGFGYSTRIPSAGSIKSAEIYFNQSSIKFEDPSLVLDLHKAIAENIDEQKTDDKYQFDQIMITYYLRAGLKQHRSFYVDSSEYMDILLNIYKSPENADGIKAISDGMGDSTLTLSRYNSTKYEYAEEGNSSDEEIADVYLSKNEFAALIDAYSTDILSATKESITRENITEYYISGVNKNHSYYGVSLYVEDSFVKTNEVLDSLNLKERMQDVTKDYQG